MIAKPMALTAAMCVLSFGMTLTAAEHYGLQPGSIELQSAGPMAFGPDGIVFFGDPQAAVVYAVRTEDASGDPNEANINVTGLNTRLAELLGAGSQEVQIADLAVNPRSGNVYLSVQAGRTPALVRVDADGQLHPVDLDDVEFAKYELPDAPEDKPVAIGNRRRNNRRMSITDLAFVDGQVVISGLSRNESPSTVRSVLFPFNERDKGSSLEIYHAAHGRSEDYAPVQTFVPMMIDGKPHLLAGFVCTPLVKIPLERVGSEEKIRGTTVAELGNRNRPLDVIAYKKDGKDYLLMANSARGMMKISAENLGQADGLTSPVKGGGTAGQPFEKVEGLDNVVQLDRLNDTHAVVVVPGENEQWDLKTIELP